MKALVIYDSAYGNTAQIAETIGSTLAAQADVAVRRVGELLPEELRGLHLLIVGSPTQGFRPTPAITNFLKEITANALNGVRVAAFDTRIAASDIKPAIFRFIVKLGGYAAEPIARLLQRQGGELIAPPAGFLVTAKEGPLKAGERERAADWARSIVTATARAPAY